MEIGDAEVFQSKVRGKASDLRHEFNGSVSMPFHDIKDTLKYAFVLWHQTGSAADLNKLIKESATGYSEIYQWAKTDSKPLDGLRDEFEMHLAMAVALTNEMQIAKQLRTDFSYEPKGNGYCYNVGYKQALLGLMLNDQKLLDSARKYLTDFNAPKHSYFPSDAVIFAAMEGDLKKLKAQVKAITKKFDSYAEKCKALIDGKIYLHKITFNYFYPYSDWAFYALAIRRFGRIDAADTFWMPMTLLNSFAVA